MAILKFMKDSRDTPLLQIENYSFTYPSYPGLPSSPLFQEMNFTLNRGEFWVILGNPECGKSTLSRCLTGLYPGFTRAETEGRILLDGENITDRSACDWIERVGIVLQGPDEQIVSSRCDDETAFALESLGLPPAEIRSRMERAFRRFSVTWPANRDPLSLSGGEKKRLLLAGLAMQDPDLWILDETLDELDRDSRSALLVELLRLTAEEGKGILLFASKYSDVFASPEIRMAILDKGRLLPLESPEDSHGLLKSRGLMTEEDLSVLGTLPESGHSRNFLELEDLRYTYPGNPDFSLRIQSFSIPPGSVTLLSGPNGCGKSTLARLLCGILEPDAGHILVEGKRADRSLLNRYCGYLFQNPDYQLFLPTVADELALGLKHSRYSRQEKLDMIDRGVSLFRLPGRDAPPSLMSYGARKRLQGAIYSLLEKRVYILDEADVGLNFTDYELLTGELKKRGAALVIISHNRELHSDEHVRIYQMAEGRLLSVSGGAAE